MKVRIQTSNLKQVIRSLKNAVPQMKRVEAVVGYDMKMCPYALFVHENLTAKNWTRSGSGPKFLETPSRLYRPGIVSAFFSVMKSTMSMSKAIQAAADYLLGKSLEVVPIKTGLLQKSAFAKVVSEERHRG